jgi:hypothetical protein
MPSSLRTVTRDFSLGRLPLETLRAAAIAERVDRRLAGEILQAIADWERSPSPQGALARNELRARAKQLIPPGPPPESEERKRNKDPAAAMYEAGLRGQRR